MLCVHDKNSGLIFPFPIHLLWVFKKQIFIFCVVSSILSPFLWMLVPKPPPKTAEQKKLELAQWRPYGCDRATRQKDVQFCKNFKGLR